MVVQHNIGGMNANRQLNIVTGIQGKSSEKLSSGYRINRAADDAAGLAISEKMRRQVRGLTQASNNAQDGISWCQIADGALDEVSNMLSRAKELAIQAANDTLTDDDRQYINDEMQKMSTEIDRIHASTEFNNIHIFAGDGYDPDEAFKAAPDGKLSFTLPTGQNIGISVGFVDSSGGVATTEETKATGDATNYGDSDFANFIKNAAANAVSKLSSNFSNLFLNAASSKIEIGLDLSKIDGKNGTLAMATLSMSGNGTSTVASYKLQVDSADYNINNYSSMTPDQKSDLAAVIAHEMTHLVMYDTLTSGMVNGFPQWFIEGVAQTSSGDNGWVSNHIGPDSSDAAIKNYMKNLSSQPYGAGYLGAMYLGYAVSKHNGNSTLSSANIAAGLDKLMTDMAKNGKSLSQAIHDNTDYDSQAAFENAFKSGSTDALNFTKTLLQERGQNGAGSLLSNLGTSESSAFSGAASGGSYNSFKINTENTWVSNAFGTDFDWPTPGSLSDNLGRDLYLQVGSETEDFDEIMVKRFNITMNSLGKGGIFDTTTRDNALATLDTVNIAGKNVSQVRSYYGALQNRLEHTIKNLDNVVENTQSAESLIRDTDMAEEMVRYSNHNILIQAGQNILAQANQTNQGVLSLLQ